MLPVVVGNVLKLFDEFPYPRLVKSPKVALLAFLLFVVLLPLSGSELMHSVLARILAVGSTLCVLLTGVYQIYAIPVGVRVMLKEGKLHSVKHWLAVCCGVSHLWLCGYLLSQFWSTALR